jgi:GNAT superfamily N-acetyltransferase
MAKRIALRRAELGDIEALQSLLREGDDFHRVHLRGLKTPGEAKVPSQQFAAWMTSPAALLLVAGRDGAVCGFLRATVADHPGGRLHPPDRSVSVDELVVQQAARRQGVGRALMAEVPGWVRVVNSSAAYLNVYSFNRDATAFYRSLGWRDHRRTLRLKLDGSGSC